MSEPGWITATAGGSLLVLVNVAMALAASYTLGIELDHVILGLVLGRVCWSDFVRTWREAKR